jgi:hypothetical protein
MQRAPALARLVKAEHVSWYADTEGNLLCRGGPARDRMRAKHPDYISPASVWELYEGRPDLLRLYTDALRGNPHPACVAEWGGFLWHVEMQTVSEDRTPVGVLCTAFILEPEPGTTTEPEPAQGCAVYEAAGDHIGYGIESGDKFLLRPGRPYVTQTRLVSLSVWRGWMGETPERVHLIHDSRAAASSRPRLRLL